MIKDFMDAFNSFVGKDMSKEDAAVQTVKKMLKMGYRNTDNFQNFVRSRLPGVSIDFSKATEELKTEKESRSKASRERNAEKKKTEITKKFDSLIDALKAEGKLTPENEKAERTKVAIQVGQDKKFRNNWRDLFDTGHIKEEDVNMDQVNYELRQKAGVKKANTYYMQRFADRLNRVDVLRATKEDIDKLKKEAYEDVTKQYRVADKRDVEAMGSRSADIAVRKKIKQTARERFLKRLGPTNTDEAYQAAEAEVFKEDIPEMRRLEDQIKDEKDETKRKELEDILKDEDKKEAYEQKIADNREVRRLAQNAMQKAFRERLVDEQKRHEEILRPKPAEGEEEQAPKQSKPRNLESLLKD